MNSIVEKLILIWVKFIIMVILDDFKFSIVYVYEYIV